MKGNTIFAARDLTVGYRTGVSENLLFVKLDLNLEAGQLICLMGPNGAGKSTLIRSLAGLQPIIAGDLSHSDEKHVAVVLTEKVNSPYMTVRDLIEFGRYPHVDWRIAMTEKDRDVMSAVIRNVGIDNLLNRRLYELSDGQMQMVMIARALAQDTPVLMLDEPTAHLDLNNRLEIMNLLRQLARENRKAVLISTHELDLALQTADEIWLAWAGKIKQGIPEDLVLDGSFDEVFQFKGFDLRTGRVHHSAFRNRSIRLEGSGPEYLWTKNALERNGFEVGASGTTTLSVQNLKWQIESHTFNNLKEVLNFLG